MSIKANIEALEQAANNFRQNAEQLIEVQGGLSQLVHNTLGHWTGTAHEKFIHVYQESEKLGQHMIERLIRIGEELEKQAKAYQEVDQTVNFKG